MKRHSALKATLASLLLLGAAGLVQAQEVKVGVNLPYTGIGAEFAQQIDRGMEQYLKLNADAVKPYTLKLIKRDVKNPGGADAKIAVQELLTQDKVDVLGGWVYSPNAIASAPIVAAGKKLAVIMNAGTAFITNLAPEYVRTSFSMWHAGYAMGEAAAKIMKVKTAVVGYTDFPPGKDSLDAFKRGFEANGGKVIDAIPMGGAGAVPDFTPFFQRAKDQKPDVFFVFVPAGDHAAAVVKTYGALGMRAAGIKLIGPGDITQDTKLQAMGDGRGRPHHHAPLQRRSRQSREQEVRRRLEEGLRRRFDARLHGGRRLQRHGGDRSCGQGDQRQDGRRRGGGLAQGLEVQRARRARSRSTRRPATSS